MTPLHHEEIHIEATIRHLKNVPLFPLRNRTSLVRCVGHAFLCSSISGFLPFSSASFSPTGCEEGEEARESALA